MQRIELGHIPAVLYDTGTKTTRACLFVHGKCGCKEEAAALAPVLAPYGIDVLAIDLPDHGERQGRGEALVPWTAVPDIAAAYDWLCARYTTVSLYAISIGAYLSMAALMGKTVDRAFFESPVLSMTRLIEGMMKVSGVTAEEVEKQGEIPTNLGETLSWRYYTYAKAHPLTDWHVPTSILWADGDLLTNRETAESFAAEHGAALYVARDCEHWFHTPEQLRIRENWRTAAVRMIRQATEADGTAIRALYEGPTPHGTNITPATRRSRQIWLQADCTFGRTRGALSARYRWRRQTISIRCRVSPTVQPRTAPSVGW